MLLVFEQNTELAGSPGGCLARANRRECSNLPTVGLEILRRMGNISAVGRDLGTCDWNMDGRVKDKPGTWQEHAPAGAVRVEPSWKEGPSGVNPGQGVRLGSGYVSVKIELLSVKTCLFAGKFLINHKLFLCS